MNELVNTLAEMKAELDAAGVSFALDGDLLRVTGPSGTTPLRIVDLYRPSSDDVEREAAPDVLLFLRAATPTAIKAAIRHNYISVPSGGYRIIGPGIALINRQAPGPLPASRQVRLSGTTGVVAETLLLGQKRRWSVRALASEAGVSPALAHRVLTRLERERFLTAHGQGPEKVRVLSNARALAELWSQEEKLPKPVARGFCYGPSLEAVAKKILQVCPGLAVGGTLAANTYKPVLTQVPPPVRLWVPGTFSLSALKTQGFEETESGANVELIRAESDPWQVHMTRHGLPRVSPWRAWLEVATVKGRTEELADALRVALEQGEEAF